MKEALGEKREAEKFFNLSKDTKKINEYIQIFNQAHEKKFKIHFSKLWT